MGHRCNQQHRRTVNLHRTVPPGVDFTESDQEWDEAFKTSILRMTAEQQWRLYPQAQPPMAARAIASALGISRHRITFQPGADAAVDDAVRRARRDGRTVYIPAPAYPGYRRACEHHGAHFRTYDARLDPADIASSVTGRAHVILCWPGNPVGPLRWTTPPARPDITWTIDATYLPVFSNSFKALLIESERRFDVIFSFSKTYGLAGVRLGGSIAASESTGEQMPFRLDFLQLATAEIITSEELRPRLDQRSERTAAQCRSIREAIRRHGHAVHVSQARAFTTIASGRRFLDRYPDLHAKWFVQDDLLRVTTCLSNLQQLSDAD